MLRSHWRWVLAALVIASPAMAQDTAGTVKSVRGPVRIVSAGSERPAAAGDALNAGERVVTGPEAAAGLSLADGTLLAVGPRSSLNLQKFGYDPTTRDGSIALELLEGSMRMVSGLIAKASARAVQVITPTAVVGIRGTDFVVEATPQP